MDKRGFSPGFRFSAIDCVILVGAGIGGAACLQINFWLAMSVWYVVTHFFLFCNVVRVARSLEFAWAGVFLSLVVGAAVLEWFSWPVVLGCSLAMTFLAIVVETRKPSYHGVGWSKINPRLPEWWRREQDSISRREG